MKASGERDIRDRAFRFALRVVRVVRAMGSDPASGVVARQLARSGTGVGANIEEAEAAHSKAEFIQKMNIARKEIREANYWLRLIAEGGLVPRTRLTMLLAESEELVRITTAIVKNARRTHD